jgi:hypothetical protein
VHLNWATRLAGHQNLRRYHLSCNKQIKYIDIL